MPWSGGALTPRLCAKMDAHLVNQIPEDAGKRCSTRKGEEGYKVCGGTRTGEPPEAVRDLGAGQGRQRGGGEPMRNDRKCSHATRGVETSGRVWRGSGVYDVQVDSVPRRDRMWGAGDIER